MIVSYPLLESLATYESRRLSHQHPLVSIHPTSNIWTRSNSLPSQSIGEYNEIFGNGDTGDVQHIGGMTNEGSSIIIESSSRASSGPERIALLDKVKRSSPIPETASEV